MNNKKVIPLVDELMHLLASQVPALLEHPLLGHTMPTTRDVIPKWIFLY